MYPCNSFLCEPPCLIPANIGLADRFCCGGVGGYILPPCPPRPLSLSLLPLLLFRVALVLRRSGSRPLVCVLVPPINAGLPTVALFLLFASVLVIVDGGDGGWGEGVGGGRELRVGLFEVAVAPSTMLPALLVAPPMFLPTTSLGRGREFEGRDPGLFPFVVFTVCSESWVSEKSFRKGR